MSLNQDTTNVWEVRVTVKDSRDRHEFAETAPMAVIVDGVPEDWGQNVFQIMAAPGHVEVAVAGREAITAPAFRLSRHQARRLPARNPVATPPAAPPVEEAQGGERLVEGEC
jgi:hypothetical protein